MIKKFVKIIMVNGRISVEEVKDVRLITKVTEKNIRFRPGYSLDSTGPDAEYGIEDLVTYDNEGNKIYPNTETDSSETNPNNIDSDNDGIYDDEELTDEEEERLADAPKVITGDDVEEEEES